ncbi:unnamed protein product, partial [Ixodes pacificus]
SDENSGVSSITTCGETSGNSFDDTGSVSSTKTCGDSSDEASGRHFSRLSPQAQESCPSLVPRVPACQEKEGRQLAPLQCTPPTGQPERKPLQWTLAVLVKFSHESGS